MDPLHRLTMRTATALGRLAELQRQVAQGGEHEPGTPLDKAVLHELSTAIEMLQAANDDFQSHLDELAFAQAESSAADMAREELGQALPIPVFWTDTAGVIERCNQSAAQLLGVGQEHLPGTSLTAFTPDLLEAIETLSGPTLPRAVDLEVAVTPRDRESRKIRVRGCRLSQETQCVWFFDDSSGK
jgi:nitrogen fixation/metabolism regulation signal transduction histidine kinase